MLGELPKFESDEDPADFAIKLRLAIFETQSAAASYLLVNPGTISKYESGATTPPLGYLASLSRLLLAQSDQAMLSDAERTAQQQFLLTQIKELIRWFPDKYKRQVPFSDWVQLYAAADHYESKRLWTSTHQAIGDAAIQKGLVPQPIGASRNQVFISYSHRDKRWLELLQKHLRPFVRQNAMEVWDDTRIKPGDLWKKQIQDALVKAKVGVLLVTPDFLDSEFIATEELPKLLATAQQEGLRIIWIAVEPSAYKTTAIPNYQAANDPSKPLSLLKTPQRNQVLVHISEVIAELMQG
jgi:TIR domain